MDDQHIDGNGIAGLLAEIAGAEMTGAMRTCQSCGDRRAVGEHLAYRTAAGIFRDLGDSVAVLSEEGRLTEIEGIGPAIEEKVRALLSTGTFPALERAREEVSDTLLALTRLPGVGPSTARKVYAALDGESFAEELRVPGEFHLDAFWSKLLAYVAKSRYFLSFVRL